MKIILFGILIIVLLINGCGQEDVNIGIPTSICKSPYIEYKVGECCVDTNNNSICDNDETSQLDNINKETSDAEHSAVRAIVEEKCNFVSGFDCPWFYITRNEIQLKLVSEYPFVYIKEIEIPNENCENLNVSKLLKFDESININIPCKFEKDSVSSTVVIYHIKENVDRENIDEKFNASNEVRYITLTTRGTLEGIVRENKESKTEEAIQGLIKEECEFSDAYFSCLKPSINKTSISFIFKNGGSKLNLTKIEIPNVPCEKTIDNISFEKGDDGQKLISIECNFNKNTVTSDIIFHVIVYDYNENLKLFEEPKEYTIKGKISGIVR